MNRRGFVSGLLAMPAIIRTPGLLMAVKPLQLDRPYFWWSDKGDDMEKLRVYIKARGNNQQFPLNTPLPGYTMPPIISWSPD